MSSFQSLIDALASDQLGFSDLLAKIDARGAVDAATHAADLATLDRALQARQIPVPMHRAMTNKLKQLQASVPPPDPGFDKTMVAPGMPEAQSSPAQDATMVASSSAARHSETSQSGSTGAGTGGKSLSTWSKVARMEDPAVAITPGYMLKGRFMLEREVGRGGMGLVYIAKDVLKEEAQDRNPYVAIKVLNDDFRRHPDALKALQREARKSQQLNHDNIVRVYDFDRDGATIYMTMEFVDGQELKDVIRDPSFDGMPMEQAAPIIEGMGLALARAHAEGIIHSDFKPGNVLLRKDNVPKVFDFGIARAAKTSDAASGETTMFDAGSLGALTPAYASLEMLQGQDPDVRDDIYALAITSYELLTGEHPFKKKNAQKAMDEGIEPPKPDGLSRRQWAALQKGLSFHKEDRPEDVHEFLHGVLGRESVLKQYQGPLMASGAAVVLVAVAIGPIVRKLDRDAAGDFLTSLTTGEFEDNTATRAAFESLDLEARQAVVSDNADSIKEYFYTRASESWNPEQQQYKAQQAKQSYELLTYLLPATVSEVFAKLQVLEGQKNQLLNALNDRYSQALEAKALYPQPGQESVADILAIISDMEPGHPLLTDPRIALAYSEDIRSVLANDQLDLAQQHIEVAAKWIPDSKEVAKLKSLVSDRLAEFAEQEKAAEQARLQAQQLARSEDELRQRLQDLAATPQFDANWVAGLRQSLGQADEMLGADSSEMQAYRTQLVGLFAQQIQAQREAAQLDQALSLSGISLELFGDASALVVERKKVVAAQQNLQRAAATQAEREIQVKARLDGLLATELFSRTLAGDIQTALADAKRVLGAANPWIAQAEGRTAERFLRLAQARQAAEAFADVESLIDQAEAVQPGFSGIAQARRELVQARQAAAQAQQARAEAAREESRQKVLAQLSNPSFTAIWEKNLAQALQGVGSQDPQFGALQSEVARAYIGRSQSLSESDRFDEALRVVASGLKLVPGANNLEEEQRRVTTDKQRYDQRKAELARVAKLEGLKNSLLTQARADDTDSVSKTLNALTKELGEKDSYIQQEARPQALNAFQRKAKKLSAAGEAAEAAAVASAGLRLFPGDSELKKLIGENQQNADRALLESVASGKRSYESSAVRAARDRLKESSPSDWKSLLGKISAAEKQAIMSQARNDRDGARRRLSAARKFLPDSAELAKLTIPSGRQPVVDNCKAEYAGFGSKRRATCFDNLPTGGRSPRMVVVPGRAGGAPFAISKYEISIRDYNQYCQASGCKLLPASIDLLPAANLSANQMQGYIKWLNAQSGWSYRLPTEQEWAHAANAAGGGAGGDFNCLLKQGSQVIKGNSAIKINVGRAGGWGLINLVGNVQEVVGTGGNYILRGGGFTDPMSSCSPELRRSWSGRAEPTVGFRLVRELG